MRGEHHQIGVDDRKFEQKRERIAGCDAAFGKLRIRIEGRRTTVLSAHCWRPPSPSESRRSGPESAIRGT